MSMNKQRFTAVAILVIILLIPIASPVTLGEQISSSFPMHNIFPTLVPKQIVYFQGKPLFLLSDKDLLTASGKIISLPVDTEKIIPNREALLLLSKSKLVSFNPTSATLATTVINNVIYIAPDLSGYAVLKNGYLYIYSIEHRFLYQIAPPIGTFSIHQASLYILKDGIIMKITNKKLSDVCSPNIHPYALLGTASNIYIVGLKGLTTFNHCSSIIPFTEQPTYISVIANYVYMLSNKGMLYKLIDNKWNREKQFSPHSRLLSKFILTPTSTYVVSDNNIVYYSSWIKAYRVKDSGITGGEPFVTLENGLSLYLSDKTPVLPTNIEKHDDKCSIWQQSYSGIVGCSPLFVATSSNNTIAIYDRNNTLTATIPLKGKKPIAYYAGKIYLIDPYGLYTINLYQKEIILTIDSKVVRVNGQTSTIDVSPRILPPGRTFVPLRFISETLGAKVEWNEDDRSILITLGDNTIQLWIGKKTIVVNGEHKKMDVAPFIDASAGRTLVPVRFIAEYLGSFVYWVPRTRRVIIIQ
ncbi:hypothetical protein GM182_03180 [bacterium 3DAC]|nr:hypothetical protein GM182_03180 [bacterium 3DAC]